MTVARGHHASDFKHHSLEVRMGPQEPQTSGGDQLLAQRFIVAGDDVLKLCSILPRICYNRDPSDGWLWVPGKVDVKINVRSNAVAEDEKDGCGNDPPSVKRLLEPFRRLHGYRVSVEGHVTASYKESIETSAAQPSPTANDVVCMASKSRDEGIEAMQKRSFGTASALLQAALDVMISAYDRICATRRTVPESDIPEESTLIEIDRLHIKVRSLLAEAYLRVGEFAKSYGCAQDLESWYYLYANANITVQTDLVHIIFCKALAGEALGQPVQALRDIDEALRYSPDNEAMKEERQILCGLVRKKLQSDVQMFWEGGLNARTVKSKKSNNSGKVKRSKKPQPSAEGYSLRERKGLERLINREIA